MMDWEEMPLSSNVLIACPELLVSEKRRLRFA